MLAVVIEHFLVSDFTLFVEFFPQVESHDLAFSPGLSHISKTGSNRLKFLFELFRGRDIQLFQELWNFRIIKGLVELFVDFRHAALIRH